MSKMEHLLFISSKSAFYSPPHFSKCRIYFSTQVKSMESSLMPFSNILLSILLQTFWTLPFKHVRNLTTFHQPCGSSQHLCITTEEQSPDWSLCLRPHSLPYSILNTAQSMSNHHPTANLLIQMALHLTESKIQTS